MKILVSKDDDILYTDLIQFLTEVKLIHGPQGLSCTYRKHPHIRDFMKRKQKEMIEEIEADYFMPDGTLNLDTLTELRAKYCRSLSLQNSDHVIKSL